MKNVISVNFKIVFWGGFFLQYLFYDFPEIYVQS